MQLKRHAILLYCLSQFNTDFDSEATAAKFIVAFSSGFRPFICLSGFSILGGNGWGAIAVSAGFYFFAAG